MRLRQEQIVFLATLLVLGLLGWSLFRGGADGVRGHSGADEKPFVSHAVPDVAAALPNDAAPALRRAIFSPPRDTEPLPPLELVEPERPPLPRLFPPTVPGPAPRAYGALLRTDQASVDEPDLFADLGEPADLVDDSFFQQGGPGAAEQPAEQHPLVPSVGGASKDDRSGQELSYAQRFARLQSYEDRYDWIVLVQGADPIFGRIENQDRYGLATDSARASEPILFTEVDPETGQEKLSKIKGPLPYARDAMTEFHFARTFANEIELRRLRIGDDLSRSSYQDALQLADDCVRRRLDAQRALPIGRELYQRCAAFDPDDPAPALGLARCYEAGFDFEHAFTQYEDLLKKFPHRPEVQVRLAQLEARFLLYDQAEARMREALRGNRGSWEARWALGKFLYDRGRYDEAIEHLRQASRLAPQEPELLQVRVEIRTDLGAALFAAGNATEAEEAFRSAINADAGCERAIAGLLGTLMATGSAIDDTVGSVAEAHGFELLYARGLLALRRGSWQQARDDLLAAKDAGPLQSNHALGALSYLADVTGHPEEALRFADEALQVDPGDPYALFQRGRLLGATEDYEGARAALSKALEVELDFEDALVALGDIAFRLGRFEDADRYLERAVSLDAKRPEVLALRGLDFLHLGRVDPAREAFDAARSLDPKNAVALGGLAWCQYLSGDTTEALIQLGNMQETLAKEPGGEADAAWAASQIARIRDHMEKVAWVDNFNRKRLLNEWVTREGAGPEVTMADGAVKIEGVFQTPDLGRTTVYRTYSPGEFVSFEADVRVWPESNVRAGIFLARERQRRGEDPELTLEASVSRYKDGKCQVRLQRAGQTPEIVDMGQPFPTDRPVRLRIERLGEGSDSTVTLSMDGVPLFENAKLPGLGRATSEVQVGLFVEGENSRQAKVEMDNVQVVYRQR